MSRAQTIRRPLGSVGLWTGLVALLLAAPGALATPAASAASASRVTATPFRTPSGQIGCYYTTGPTFLRCDVTYRTRFSGKRCAEGEYGPAFGMTPSARAHALCVSDTAIEPRAPVLRYGTTRRYGPYTCTSRRNGLTCRNGRSHGWTLSRGRQYLF
jgi:hypothetical protein